MKLQKVANILFALCFVVFLLLGASVTLLKPKDTVSFFENRMLAPIPILTRSSLLDGTWFSGWETYLKDHAAGRTTLLKVNTFLDLKVLRRPVVNDVVVSNGMLLGYNKYETVDRRDIIKQSEEIVEKMKALNTVIEHYGGVFYYVAVPGQYTYFGDKYPTYLNNRAKYTEFELQCFKTEMAEQGLSLLDMGDVFDGLGNPQNMYSSADYHYTFFGAYETYKSIITALNNNAGFVMPLTTLDDLTVIALKNDYLGSRERKLFNLVNTGEKLFIGVLNEKLPFKRTDYGIAVAPIVYSYPSNDWDTVSYSVYMGGDFAETVISTNRPELPDVLIVGDSFTNPVECLLYSSCDELRSLDLRQYKDIPLNEYIQKYQPDIVIMLRDYEVLLSSDGNGSVFK